jgi:hypothetical protein
MKIRDGHRSAGTQKSEKRTVTSNPTLLYCVLFPQLSSPLIPPLSLSFSVTFPVTKRNLTPTARATKRNLTLTARANSDQDPALAMAEQSDRANDTQIVTSVTLQVG